MSDSVKKWHEMKEDEKACRKHATKINEMNYIWVLDFNYGTVHRYNVKRDDLDHEDYETLITLHGHNVGDCEWMVCHNKEISD